MLEILKKLLVSGEAALIYTDDQNTSKFHYGIICWSLINSNNILNAFNGFYPIHHKFQGRHIGNL